MSQQIDNQIVKMQFDNASFEKNVQQSMSTLDKLKQALKFDKVDMTPLQQAFSETEATATKAGFHIRDVWLKVGSIIEQEVAQKVVDAGKKIFNALTMEGITDGFKEYELKMGSIQTIMAGTGESLATVNKYLDELNTYSDQTIYSFADMTNNIGKFTNAGVKLEDAVNAIKGIANEAAVSGANANEASRAMYNFSQALSAGYVKLIDWKSIENANMATKEFKETLLEVGTACGTVKKDADGMYQVLTENNQGKTMDDLVSGTKNFNDSLQYQWMTTEVLTKALKIYATDIRTLEDAERDAYEAELKAMGLNDEQIKRFEELGQKATDAASEIKTFSMLMDTLKEAIGSGWAMTWQIIIGDFEQAKALWTDVGNTVSSVIDGMSDARNNFLRQGLRTGWEKTLAGGGLKDVIPDAEKFRGILVDLAHEQGILNQEQYDGIYSTETFMKSLHQDRWMTGELLTEAVDDYVNIIKSLSEAERSEMGFDNATLQNLESFQTKLHQSAETANEFAESMNELGGRENIIQGLSNIFHSLLDVLKPIGQAFNEVFGILDPGNLFDLTKRFKEFTEELKVSEDAANTIHTAFTLAFGGIKTIIGAVATALNGFTKLILPVLNLFDAIFGLIGKVVSALTGSKGALDAANKFSKIGDKISNKYLKAMQKLADFINKVADAIRNIPEATIFVKIHDGVESAITALQEFWNEFVNMPVIQQMITDFNNTVADIERKVTPVVNAVEKAFADLKTKIKSYLNLETLNRVLTTVYNKVKDFIKIVKDFADRIKNFFSNLKQGKSVVESFRDSFGDIIDKIKELKDNLFEFFDNLFSKGDEIGDKFDLASIQQAIHDFVTNITPDQVTMIAVAGTFMLIAINMLRLSEALKNAVDAFTGIGVALKNVINSYIKKQKSTILQVAEAIVIVAAALWVLSKVPRGDLEAAIGAIAILTGLIAGLTVVLTLCGVAMHKWGGKKSMVELASGLVFVSGAFMVAVLALKALEYVKLDGILPKIAVLAVIMVGLVGLSALMAKLDKFNKGSLIMVAVSAALLIAATALAKIGEIPKDKLNDSMDVIFKLMIGLAAVTFAAGKVGIFSAVGLIAVIMTLDKILPMIEKIVNYDYTNIEDGLQKNEVILKKVGVLVGAMVIIGALAGNRLKGAGIAMLSIAATFAILVGVAKLASMLKPTELAKGEEFLWHMTAMIAVLEICAGKSKAFLSTGKEGKQFIRIAFAMGILLGIAKLASMMSWKEIAKGEAAILGLVGLIGAMTWVSKKASGSEGVIKSVATMIFAISVILAEVAVLSMIPLENMKPALTAILDIIGALALFALAISKNIHVFDKATMSASGAAPLIASMVIVAVLGGMLIALSQMPLEGVKTAAKGMVAVIASVAMVAAALGTIKGKGNMAQLQAAVESIVMIALVAGILSVLSQYIKKNNIDANTMLKAARAISIVMVGITPALLAMSLLGHVNGDWKAIVPSVVGAIAALVAVAGAIGLLSNFGKDGDTMIKSAIALAIGLVAICAPMAVLGAVGKFVQSVDLKSMATIVGGAIVTLAGVTGAILVLSNLGNPTTMVQSAQALGLALLAISVPIAVLGAVGQLCQRANVGVMWSAVGGAIVAMAAITGLLIWFGNSLDLTQIEVLNAAIPVLITCMGGVAALAIALAFAGTIAAVMPGSIGATFGILVVAIVAFAAVVAAIIGLGALMEEWDKSRTYLESGLDALIVIFGKLGEAVGALLDGFGLGATAHLDVITERLNKFAEDMIPFSENMSKISDEVVTGCKNIAAAMLYLTAADFLDALTKITPLGLVKGDNNFGSLGEAIADFCDSVKDIPEEAVSKASVCSVIAKRLAEVSGSLDTKGGLAGLIFGDKQSLDDFAEGVAKFGHAILSFCNSVKGLSDNAAELAQNATDAAVPLIDLTKMLVAQGGLLQDIAGNKDLGQFGTSITKFVTGLAAFIKALLAIEKVAPNYKDLIQNCADATTPLIDLANGLENIGGILSGIVGDNTLDLFGEKLGPFADGLSAFVGKMKGVVSLAPNYKQLIIDAAEATTHLVTLANSLENMGGVGSWFSGDNTLSKFGETLVQFANYLSIFCTQIVSTDLSVIENAAISIETLINLGQKALGIPATAFDGLVTSLRNVSSLSLNSILQEINKATPTIVQAFANLLTRLTTLANNRTISDAHYYKTYGEHVDSGVGNGITMYIKLVTDALGNLLEAIHSNLRDNMKESNFFDYGANVSIGIANGISAHIEDAVTAAQSMADAVNAVVPKTLQEKSPSRLAYKYGEYYSVGLAYGIRDYTGTAVGAAEEMSMDIVNIANNIVSSILAVINSDIDFDPVIRPVLDTSDIEDKAKSIGKIFSGSDLALAYSASGGIKASVNAKNNGITSSNNTSYTYGGTTIYVTARDGESADQIADRVINKLDRQMSRRKAVIGS